MLRALKDFFDAMAPSAASPADQEHHLQLATAVLLVEVMRADPGMQPAERDAVLAALRRKFALGQEELDELMGLAEAKAREANDFFAFTSTLNESLEHGQKVRVVEFMWQVAFADGALDENENHVISKVAGLLHVTHGEYIAAKLHARQGAGLGTP